MSEISERSTPVSGPLSVTPLYAAGDQIVLWDGANWSELAPGGSSGPINLTGDVLGSGTGTVPTTVLGLQRRPVSSTAPLDGQVLGWSAGQWRPVPAAVVTGGGGPPGGATGTVQINAGGGNFGGIAIGPSGDATLNTSTGALALNPSGVAAGTYQGITFDVKGRATTALNMNYAPLLSPNFMGIPQADTAAPGNNSRQLATTAYVDSLYSPGAYIDTNGVSVTLSDGVSANLCSVSLAAGDWIIDGSAYFNSGTALNFNFMLGASTTPATLPGIPFYTQLSPAGSVSGGVWTLNIPERKFSFTVPTTVYLVVRAGFGSGSTVTAQGHIAAQQLQKLITGAGGGGPITLSGDISTAGTIATVTGLQGRPIATTAPSDTQVLAWSSGAWRPTPAGTGGSGTPGGSSTQVQYNTGTGFGGSSGATFSATQLTSLAMGLGGDALGDIYFRNVTGHLQALPAGSPGFVMQMQGGVPTWQSIALGGGTVNPGTVGQIAQYTGSIIVGGVTMSGDATIAAGGALTLRPIGTAGSYNNVTTDANGRVVAGSNVAYLTANQTITLIGDNTGSGASGNINTVTVGLQGRQVANTAPTANGDVLAWHVINNRWQPFPAATGGGITSITFAAPLTGGTISTSGQTVGLTVPSADLLAGNGSIFGSVTVGTGLSITGTFPTRTLVATASGGNVTAGTLTTNALTVGTGPQAIATLASTGTATTVLHGNASGLPTFGPIDLSTAQVTGNLHAGNLGSGTGASNLTFWRGDETWATPPGGGSGTVVASLQFQIPYYATAGSVASVQGHPALTTTTGGSLAINRSAAAMPGAVGTTALQINFNDAESGGLVFDTHGGASAAASSVVFRTARGTAAQAVAPNAACQTLAADALGNIHWRGYEATTPGYTTPIARIVVTALEPFSNAAQGTKLEIFTNPPGTTNGPVQATFDRGITVGAPTAQASPATGDINCVRLFVGGQSPFLDTTATLAASAVNPAITTQLVVVTPVAVGHGVTLPTGAVGAHCIVRNSGANTLNVLPVSTAQINNLGNGVAITVLPNSTAYFEAMSSAQWFTVP